MYVLCITQVDSSIFLKVNFAKGMVNTSISISIRFKRSKTKEHNCFLFFFWFNSGGCKVVNNHATLAVSLHRLLLDLLAFRLKLYCAVTFFGLHSRACADLCDILLFIIYATLRDKQKASWFIGYQQPLRWSCLTSEVSLVTFFLNPLYIGRTNQLNCNGKCPGLWSTDDLNEMKFP